MVIIVDMEAKSYFTTLLAFPVLVMALQPLHSDLKQVFSWKTLNFVESPEENQNEFASSFEPMNNLPNGIAVWRDKLFISVPRVASGVPSTVNYVHIPNLTEITTSSPFLTPYPSLSENTPSPDSDSFISVYSLRVDKCNRLWTMDVGDVKSQHMPRLIIYNLLNDQRHHQFIFSDDLIGNRSLFANLVVDAPENDCGNAFAYIPDLINSLVVYNLKEDKAWKITHHFFNIDPLTSNHYIAYGLFGLALTSRNQDGVQDAYFHPLASNLLFRVNTSVLHSQTKSHDYHAYHLVGDKGPDSQTTTSVIDSDSNVMFYTQISKHAVYCWNTKKPFKMENLVGIENHPAGHEPNSLKIYPADITIDHNNNLWILSNKLARYQPIPLNQGEFNHHVFVIPIKKAIASTKCASDRNAYPILLLVLLPIISLL